MPARISRMGLSPESRRVIRKGLDIGKLVLKGLGIVRKVGKGVRKIIKPREIPRNNTYIRRGWIKNASKNKFRHN